MQRASPLLMRHPRTRETRGDWRLGLPRGEVNLTTRVALKVEVHVSLAPDHTAQQTRILPLRVIGANPGKLLVSYGGFSAVVGRDGDFTLRGGGANRVGAWREMVVGRVEGRRILISIYQCHLVGDLGADHKPVSAKVLFRGTSWAPVPLQTVARSPH